MSASALVVFAKAPLPGLVKTRLCPPLDLEQAADLYSCMLDDVLEESAAACDRVGAQLFVTVHPETAVAVMAERLPRRARAIAQHGTDLAARMQHAIGQCAAAGYERIALRGSDSPMMPGRRIDEAFEALERADLALCRDADGGYDLLSLCRPHAGLLDHAMSTASVADDTLANARRLGLTCCELEPGFDLDTSHDLARLRRERNALQPGSCRRTLELLDREGWWPA